MNVLIIGAGAIGMWMADRLGPHHAVTLVGRERFAAQALTQGVKVDAPNGVTRRLSPVVATAVRGVDTRAFDVIAFTTKAYALQQAIDEVRASPRTFAEGTRFVCLQNGVGNEEALAGAFGEKAVIAATTTTPVSVLAPNHIRIEREQGGVALAPMAKRDIGDLVHILRAEDVTNYRALKWSKLLLNLVGNATSAIFDAPVAQIYADRAGFSIEYRMLREALAVMRALKIPVIDLPGGSATRLKSALTLLPQQLVRPILGRVAARARGEKKPSFQQDIDTGAKQSEVGWLNGAVAAHGARCGVAVPVNGRLTRVLEALVAGNENREDWRSNFARFDAAA